LPWGWRGGPLLRRCWLRRLLGLSLAFVDEIEDVLLRDAAAGSGPIHFCQIYVVFAG
jgi:hypothetical protein